MMSLGTIRTLNWNPFLFLALSHETILPRDMFDGPGCMYMWLYSFLYFFVRRFPNDPCIGGEMLTHEGICYTPEQCLSKGGSNGGFCASGFGVCCLCKISIFLLNSHICNRGK